MLRCAYDNGAGVQPPPIIMIEGEEEPGVLEILNYSLAYTSRSDTNIRLCRTLRQWKGCGPAYNSWEPASTLNRNASDTLSDYWDLLEAAVASS